MANQVNIFPADSNRNDLQRALDNLAASKGITVEQLMSDYNITPFVVLMAAYLSTTASSYSLHPRNGVDPVISGTALLDQNDVFIANGIGLRFGRAAYANGVYSNHGIYPKYTYPDPTYFSGNGTTAGVEAAQLLAVVNGQVSLNVQSTAVIDKLNAQELCYNPQRAYSAGSGVQFGGGDDQSRGFFHLAPIFTLDAMADNEIVVQLATGPKGNIDGNISSATTDSGVRNILYVALQGWKVKNFANGGNKIACS